MSFSVDQFLQVNCKFQLTSETDTTESIRPHNEKVRLCTSVEFDKNSTVIVMICTNETSSNHIVTYYVEKRVKTKLISAEISLIGQNNLESSQRLSLDQSITQSMISTTNSSITSLSTTSNTVASSAQPPIATTTVANQNYNNNTSKAQINPQQRTLAGYITRVKPRTIVKQIYYHDYNEDIVALCLSENGNKLVLVNASATIYLLPIKNILLNLHAKQLRSSQGKSMRFYDASILNCCKIDNPIAVAHWEALDSMNKSIVIVAGENGQISFISLEDKREIHSTNINETIKSLKVIRDRFGFSLLISCKNLRQFRYTLELVKQQDENQDHQQNGQAFVDEYVYLENDLIPTKDKKPIEIKLHNRSPPQSSKTTKGTFKRVFSPVNGTSSLLNSLHGKDKISHEIFYPAFNLIALVDVLEPQKSILSSNNRSISPEPRLLRFFHGKLYYYRPQMPFLVCKLTCLESDEIITHLVLTDRFLVVATDKDRCLINSRNCCNFKNTANSLDLNPLMKEISFSNEEKIVLLIKSPVSNDQDGIIDSFLLVTTRSVYSIEARQSCRDMYINLIDTHLGIREARMKGNLSGSLLSYGLCPQEYNLVNDFMQRRKNYESNLLIRSFLNNRDGIFDKISNDTKVYSTLFKLELSSLFEAYGDEMLIRGQFDIANRFFRLAKFDHTKTLSKYSKLGSYKQTIDYITIKKYSTAALRQLDSFRKLSLEKNNGDTINTFTDLQKRKIEDTFLEFLSISLDECTEDSCRLWYNYINFFLNYVGTKEDLEKYILDILESNSADCRIAITLYKAISRDDKHPSRLIDSSVSNLLEQMEKSFRISRLFSNEFLIQLLEKTLGLVPESSDLDGINDCLGVDSLTGSIPLPIENAWRQILKTIQSAVGSVPAQQVAFANI